MTLLRNGEVLPAGGMTPGYDLFSNTAELYNPSTGTWRATASMDNYHPLALRTLQDGRALRIDAGDGASQLYDPSTGQWTFTGGMYFTFTGGTENTVMLRNGNVLVYGNILPSYASQFYDPTANTWTRTFGQSIIQVGPLALLNTGKVLLAGGHVKYGGATRLCHLYDPSTNRWSGTGSLIQPGVSTLTPLTNGQVLAVTNTDVELYTP